MFQDPSKSQGLFGDMGSLFSGNNRAAVYADEYNPFPEAGFGEDWYKDKFKFASGLGSLMEAAENFIPGIGTAKRMFSKEREPLERDPRYTPVPGSADWESSVFDPVEDVTENITDMGIDEQVDVEPELDLLESPLGPTFDLDKAIEDERAGKIKFEPWVASPPYPPEVDETEIETITEDDGEKFVLKKAKFSAGNLGTEGKYDYTTFRDLNIMNIKDSELRNKAVQAATRFNNLWIEKEGKEDKSDMYELERLYDEYMAAVEAGAQ